MDTYLDCNNVHFNNNNYYNKQHLLVTFEQKTYTIKNMIRHGVNNCGTGYSEFRVASLQS